MNSEELDSELTIKLPMEGLGISSVKQLNTFKSVSFKLFKISPEVKNSSEI